MIKNSIPNLTLSFILDSKKHIDSYWIPNLSHIWHIYIWRCPKIGYPFYHPRYFHSWMFDSKNTLKTWMFGHPPRLISEHIDHKSSMAILTLFLPICLLFQGSGALASSMAILIPFSKHLCPSHGWKIVPQGTWTRCCFAGSPHGSPAGSGSVRMIHLGKFRHLGEMAQQKSQAIF